MMTNILVVTALMQKYGMFPQLNITPNTLCPKAVASSSLSLNYRLYSQRVPQVLQNSTHAGADNGQRSAGSIKKP